MKKENECKDVILNLECDPFSIYYYNPKQIHMYRKYFTSVTHKWIIDATGSVVKNFIKFGLEKTKNLFLYEAVVYIKGKNHIFTVTNMVSESDNTITILNWLSNRMASTMFPSLIRLLERSPWALLSEILWKYLLSILLYKSI